MKTLRKDFRSLLAGHWKTGVPVGVLSAIAYWVIVWAMSVAPMALVAAARETSILFAAVVSWGVLGEKLRPLRWAGVVVTVVGLLLAKFQAGRVETQAPYSSSIFATIIIAASSKPPSIIVDPSGIASSDNPPTLAGTVANSLLNTTTS